MRRVLALLLLISAPAYSYVNLTGAFAFNGGYKIAKQDLWPLGSCSTCTISPNWNGTTAKAAGFKNEMIGLGLLLQGGSSDATNVHVALSQLNGPSGSILSSTPTLCAATTQYLTRDFEVFVATYVQIKGMTEDSWNTQPYEERDLPTRFRNGYTVNGNNDGICNGSCLWTTRPDANKFEPDALIPEECVSSFTVAASSSQLVWMDFSLAKTLNAGTYSGTITVTEGVTVSTTIPIQLTVYSGTMPDQPNLPYLAYMTEGDLAYRINGYSHSDWNNIGPCVSAACNATYNATYQMLHRHRLIPMGDFPDTATKDYPSTRYRPQLDGSLYTAAYGYRGPGTNTGAPVYSIGTYGAWKNNSNWSQTDPNAFCVAVSSWGAWFQNNAPAVRSFVYLDDEPVSLTNVAKWSEWMSTITACQYAGYKVHSWVTNNLVNIAAGAPYLDMPANTESIAIGHTQTDWITAANTYCTAGSTQCYIYNGHPSWLGTVFATEDDGISNWEGTWGDYLKGVNGHFIWDTTNWYGVGQSPNENPLWTQAKTFGYYASDDSIMGQKGFDYSNGDGVLLYPGTEVSTYTASNYGILGPIASLRLKNLRRSINDYDYLKMANAINHSATQAILTGLVPSALWDINCFTYSDCSYSYGGRLWDQNPSDWETARQSLEAIIDGGGTTTTTTTSTTTTVPGNSWTIW